MGITIEQEMAGIAQRIRNYQDQIKELREILEQVVDDFGDGHCVCEATKEMCIAKVGTIS